MMRNISLTSEHFIDMNRMTLVYVFQFFWAIFYKTLAIFEYILCLKHCLLLSQLLEALCDRGLKIA